MLGEARSGRTGQLLVDVPFALALICALVNVAWKLLLSPSEAASLIDWLYNLTFVLGGLACLGRALHSPGVRAAWLAFGAALISWGVGDIYWTEVFASAGRVPYPSPADIGYLLAPVCLFAGIALLMRDRGCFTLASCFDAAIGALAATALGTAFLAPALEGLTRGDSAAVLTNVSYPIFDLLLVAMIAGSVVIGGLRGARSLLAVGAGLIVWTGADVQYLFLEATGSYEPGWIDMTWAAGALLIAGGASLRPTRNSTTAHVYRSQIVLLTTFSLIAVGILVWDHFERVRGISIWLAGATILAVAVRLAVSFRENERLMLELHDDTVTDALTGLGNRRKLYADLDVLLPQSRIGSTHHMFAIFDLDGFKSYNDTFGHPAGDALLRRCGEQLACVVTEHGSAYRLGGDEFCVLVELGRRRPEPVVEAARAALTEAGEGFAISASGGWVLLPEEADRGDEILRTADQRMYAEKSGRSPTSMRQTQEVLMRIFREREPALGDHSHGVARLAAAIGRRLGLDAEAQDVLVRAAELHDIGKIAIPDEVLHKRGPLDDGELELMRRHTLIGDRILGATAAMRPVGELVRSSHERWDGSGYPDRLAGEAIPLGSRIISICDSFDAMTSSRPYRAAVEGEQALDEVRSCAGSQFDADLVEVFASVLEEWGSSASSQLLPPTGRAGSRPSAAAPARPPA